MFRNLEKGAFAKWALRKFVANCAPNLRKIAGSSLRTSGEGCAKLSQICRELESQFRTILCKYPFSNAPFSKFLKCTILPEVTYKENSSAATAEIKSSHIFLKAAAACSNDSQKTGRVQLHRAKPCPNAETCNNICQRYSQNKLQVTA